MRIPLYIINHHPLSSLEPSSYCVLPTSLSVLSRLDGQAIIRHVLCAIAAVGVASDGLVLPYLDIPGEMPATAHVSDLKQQQR